MIRSKVILFPYYLTLKLRNRLYDKGIFKSKQFDVPVISIDNITAGGTGKTPTTELVVRLLKPQHKVAVLSRGYKRKTRGFRIVDTDSTSREVGDEPLQIRKKHKDVLVAVDANRTRGITQLLALPQEIRPEVIVLDDAYQHRKVLPLKNILLIDYNRPLFRDNLLPIGRLRDLPEQIERADAIVITKSPEHLDEWERETIKKANRINDDCPCFFARIKYCPIEPIFAELGDKRYIYSKEVGLFTGIANVKPLMMHLSDIYEQITHISYRDHHEFTRGNIRDIEYFARRNPQSLLLTTEKDAQRLVSNRHLTPELKKRLFYIPIETEFLTIEESYSFRNFIAESISSGNSFYGTLF
ncbi:MAG TPA: tetraacyldisaccharide 4'-kinase [Bacteroidales bacterium]|nr:tetraacyldisaccharide 4'-kinase [Bacteroidales bacterium]HQA92764.1 tetraacyldisaccharide 4'-kinase [Bacteroidales bacterium]HQN24563.1 tetraacyldisaccharide 4'-kinase [Bacteroidales bacterium]HQP79844.1 tetraacyldisaccharide 4'-kinase [Bacteroidales bacterium]